MVFNNRNERVMNSMYNSKTVRLNHNKKHKHNLTYTDQMHQSSKHYTAGAGSHQFIQREGTQQYAASKQRGNDLGRLHYDTPSRLSPEGLKKYNEKIMVCQTDLDKDSHIGSSSEILVYESRRSLNRRKLKNASP